MIGGLLHIFQPQFKSLQTPVSRWHLKFERHIKPAKHSEVERLGMIRRGSARSCNGELGKLAIFDYGIKTEPVKHAGGSLHLP